MPRFVVLRHETPADYARPTHWDLMLEVGSVLRTWALEQEPTGNESVEAELLVDHRLAYLDYEGPVSNDRGVVTRWDAGEYRMLDESPDRLALWFSGVRLRGEGVLTRADSAGADDQRWRLCFPKSTEAC